MAQVTSSTGGFDFNFPYSENFLQTNPGTLTGFSGTTDTGLFVSFTGNNFSYFTRDDGLQALIGGQIFSITVVEPNQASIVISDLNMFVDQYKTLVAAGNFYRAILGGNDTLTGGEGNDFMIGGAGNDRLIGNLGDDVLYGNIGADILYGGDGNDILFGGQDSDSIYAGSGNNVIYGNLLADRLIGGNDKDVFYGGQGADFIYGFAGNDLLMGNKGDDTLAGADGNDTLIGGTGNDSLYGGFGVDVFIIQYGGGVDRIRDYDSTIDKLSLYDGWNITYEGTGYFGDVNYSFVDGSKLQMLGWTYLSLTGSNSAEYYADRGANGINDVINGLGGNDTFYAGLGKDLVYGGEGNDLIKSEDSVDTVFGESGNDYIDAGSNDDMLYGGGGDDTLIGNQGWDTIYGGAGDDLIDFTDEDDGSDNTFIYNTSDGDDTIDGFSGYFNPFQVDYKSQTDVITFIGGTSVVDSNPISGGLILSLSNSSSITLIGSNFNITSTGSDIFGFWGNDTLYGGLNSDELYGSAGDDLIYGYAGKDVITPGTGSGYYMLNGMSDNDTMYGGTGNDEFYFYKDQGNDLIGDFALGDRIYIYDMAISNVTDIGTGTRINLSTGDVIDVIGGTLENMNGNVFVDGASISFL